ncbi:winged helix-turn-helix transcriptional regulator [Bacillus aquiflavi]|uniref:Winged helix-turn-helix transcriptional regulator n=1 Tax=Bacillus aquiflavi TaxID=2672567 RepID=A0A6B3VZB8_9BACI|nr:winged helix-turn-helix domain-containing protein [Bacillus aquiflavi]MBA4536559.1 winged helix-turn-helix transcriptional regulator [Bacillus aquiflavi]NEY80926.1 winged helix-turn-helix transcriptional regulator [Bacillus aquiflavi]UAC49643.1 winged helix-turn-helix domain-containing protein [Bacillus aquiflavi]
MACINNPDHLTISAKKILHAIQDNYLSEEEIGKHTQLPLYKVRSHLRELNEKGLISKQNDKYKVQQHLHP